MISAAIYARFSTDLQHERSIDDQVALCRALAAREGLAIAAVYQDRAKSGASIHGRDGLAALLAAARRRAFAVVLVEAFDRLSRDMADLAAIFKDLTFLGIEIRAVHDGTASPLLIGLRGLVGQMQREDGAKKVRRGMAGVVRSGRHAGGRAYGYGHVPGHPGELAIVEGEATIVRRIFADYIAGSTPRAIAAALNAERVQPPRGARWNASTINGNAARGGGILLNELYAGRIVWNKVRMVKDPATGRRVSRPNPAAEHQTNAAPHLAIVDPDTWRRAQELKAQRRREPATRARKPPRLLSGLLRCGACGAGMTSIGRDRSGKTRAQCSAHQQSGTCSNQRRIYVEDVERTLLAGLSRRLKERAYFAQWLKGYNEEMRRLASAAGSKRARLERRAGEIARELQRAVDLVVKAGADPSTMRETIATLQAERDTVAAELAGLAEGSKVVTLHPGALAQYHADVDRLAELIAQHRADGLSDEAVTRLRKLVAAVIVAIPGGRPGEIEVHGRIDALIAQDDAASTAAVARGSVRGGSLVAEARYRRSPPHGRAFIYRDFCGIM